ncbi:hypothetical protein KCP69_18365 [Salmonella enterica subsp. enterica]|nr:hypothetical protein KCP69_18365 [Salmonella enterica subsp. enterica]
MLQPAPVLPMPTPRRHAGAIAHRPSVPPRHRRRLIPDAVQLYSDLPRQVSVCAFSLPAVTAARQYVPSDDTPPSPPVPSLPSPFRCSTLACCPVPSVTAT